MKIRTHKIIIFLVIVGIFIFFAEQTSKNGTPLPLIPSLMKISSPAFENNGNIPAKFTCDAENISPELSFMDVPEEAKSLALITHDPDAPVEGGWTHWVVINMDPSTAGIAENSKPSSGLEATTSFGTPGYGGPCPPSGSHRYYFYLYALDSMLDLDASATKTDVEAAMKDHVLEETLLMGTYQRQ